MAEKLERNTSFPLYMQVLGRIQYAIDSGKYKVGDMIPSEPELEKRFSVSRVTVRRAIQGLVDSGYLVKKPGKGTFVCEHGKLEVVQLSWDIDTPSFTRACRKAGMVPGSIELGSEVRAPNEEEQGFLRLQPDGEVFRLKRVHTANGIPIMANFSSFARGEFPFLEDEDLKDRSLIELIEDRTGRTLNLKGKCTLSSDRAVGDMAKWLRVPEGEPLLWLHAHYVDQDDEPMYLEDQALVGSRYTFTF